MKTFIKILLIIFVVIFVAKQSNVVEKTRTFDRRIGAYREEYHINPENLKSYFADVSDQIKSLPGRIKKKFKK